MSGKKLRIAIVGLGFVRLVLKEYLAAPGVEVVLLCDVNETRCQELAKEYGIPTTTRFEDCLADGIDVVDVSTPNHLHASQAIAAMEAGKHVFLQKPMAPSVADCRSIIEAGKRTGRTVGLFMSSIGDPVYQELRAMVAAGAFGTVTSLRARMAHRNSHLNWKRWNYSADYWRRKKELVGGGGMALIGIHAINLVPWMAGSPIESVMAYSDNLASKGVLEGDDITAAVCRLASGQIAALEAGYSSENNSFEIYGSAGFAVRDSRQGGTLRVKLDSPWKGRLLELPGGESESVFILSELKARMAPLLVEYEQHGVFARAVLSGQTPPMTGEDGCRDVAVLEAIYRSAASGQREQPQFDGVAAK